MNVRKTWCWRSIHTASAVTALTLLAAGSTSAQTQASRIVTVAHWGSERILIYLPLYVAIDGGFFAREGLDVRLLYSGNDDQVFAAVRAGKAKFGVGDPAFAAIARSRGGGGRVIAPLVTALTNWGVSRGSRPIRDSRDLVGMRVTSFPRPSTTYTILSAINDTSVGKFSIVQTAFGSELAVVSRGDADIAMLLEPQTSLAEEAGYTVVWSLAKQFAPFLLTGISTTDEVLLTSRADAVAFLRALENTFVFIRSSPDSAARLVTKSFPTLAAPVVSRAVKRLVADGGVPHSAVVPIDGWRRVLALRQMAGEIKDSALAFSALDTLLAAEARNSVHTSGAGGQSAKLALTQVKAPADVWDWLGRASDILELVAVLGGIIYFLRWKHKVRTIGGNLNEQFRQIVVVMEPLLGEAGSQVPRTDLVRTLAGKTSAATAEVKDAIRQLMVLGALEQDGDLIQSPINRKEKTTELRLLIQRLRARGVL